MQTTNTRSIVVMIMLLLLCTWSINGLATAAGNNENSSKESSKSSSRESEHNMATTSAYAYQASLTQPTSQAIFNGIKAESAYTWTWLGIPYAKPPVGELRWRAPQTPTATPAQTIAATTLPQICTQLVNDKVVGSEDCLYLNIYRPATTEESLPVLVFLHGGGNVTGSGGSFDGSVLAAKTNAVIVTINYRLGLLGWMRSPALLTGNAAEDSGNFALLDQIQALKWVQQHIASFGGNAANVTLGGQSAGARDVLALTISPLAKGLFVKAMPLSGGMTTSSPAQGEAYDNEKLAAVLVKAGKVQTIAEGVRYLKQTSPTELAQTLRSLDSGLLVEAVGKVMIRMSEFPHLFTDGTVLPEQGFNIIDHGQYNRVPMLIGSMQHEFNAFAAFDPIFFTSFMKNDWQPTLQKQFWQATAYGSELYSSFNADQVAAKYSQDPQAQNMYAYRFAWGLDGDGLKVPAKYLAATHGVDLDFLTGAFDKSAFAALFKHQFYTAANEKGRLALADRYRDYVSNFLHGRSIQSGGLMPWSTWQQSGKLMKLDATATTVYTEMIKGKPDADALKTQIEASLTPQAKAVVWDKVLNGRFFFDPQY
ncbi:carboxylesterase family protein [Paenibacillus sp. SGZ-1009]|uniref:carboxylesterase family protein n=1 Tax=Paenibacillus campi TaxID=3106031 RepID=UPI002AFF75E4|nr:carboxylesterase family protein [Paenibacillus sp. SGZ-1009]